LELYQRLTALNKPFIVVLNKVDLIKRQLKDVVAITARNLGLREEQIIPVSATRGSGIDEVLLAIASADPGMIVALAKALPQYRWQLAWKTIVSGASASAVIALTPLPIIDFVPLLAIQTSMVLAIARFYQYKITLARARELVITFGIAFIGRTLFYELSKFGGIPGWMLAAAIASSTTVAMGYAAAAWFSKGERLSDEALKNITKRTTDMILNRLKSIGKKKPQGQSLKNEISEILADPHTDEIVISEDHAQDRAAGNQEPLQAPSNPPHIAEDQ